MAWHHRNCSHFLKIEVYFYTRDHLGSVREVLDGTGAIKARYDYNPYGVTTLVQGTNLADFQYAGMYIHQPSGLYLTSHRGYEPPTGRFLSRDPIGEDGGLNLFEYCGDDPINWVDPDGLKKCYRWLLITFYKNPSGNHNNPLTPNDAAAGNLHYKPNGTRHPDTTGVTGQAYPNGTVFNIQRPDGKTDHRTVNDSGKGFAEPRSDMGLPMGVPPDGWLDLYTNSLKRARNGNPEWDLTETDVGDNCKCPSGWSETPPAAHP